MSSSSKRLALGCLAAAIGVPMTLCAGTGLAGLGVDGHVGFEVVEELDAPPGVVHDHLDSAAGIASWWALAMEAQEMPDAMDVVHAGGPEAGVGCVVDFVAGGITAETWTVLEVEPDRRVVYDVDFKVMHVERTVVLEPTERGTRVRWSEQGHIGNPWMRILSVATGGTEGVEQNVRLALEALEAASTD